MKVTIDRPRQSDRKTGIATGRTKVLPLRSNAWKSDATLMEFDVAGQDGRVLIKHGRFRQPVAFRQCESMQPSQVPFRGRITFPRLPGSLAKSGFIHTQYRSRLYSQGKNSGMWRDCRFVGSIRSSLDPAREMMHHVGSRDCACNT